MPDPYHVDLPAQYHQLKNANHIIMLALDRHHVVSVRVCADESHSG